MMTMKLSTPLAQLPARLVGTSPPTIKITSHEEIMIRVNLGIIKNTKMDGTLSKGDIMKEAM